MQIIDKLFGKYATIVSVALVFIVGGASAAGFIDAGVATMILGVLGLHAGASKGLVASPGLAA